MSSRVISLTSALLLSASAAPATAAGEADHCSVAGSTLSVTAPAGSTSLRLILDLDSGGQPRYAVQGLTAQEADCQGPAAALTQVALADTDAAVSRWVVSRWTSAAPDVVVGNGVDDVVRLDGTTGDDAWRSVSGSGLDLDSDGAADLSLGGLPAMLELAPSLGSDAVDLQGSVPWTGATTIDARFDSSLTHDVIDGGEGPDVIFDGIGGDTVRGHGGNDVLTVGYGHDDIDPGAGDDDVTVFDDNVADVVRSSEGLDTLRVAGGTGSSYDPLHAGGDGSPGEGDTWQAFETFHGTSAYDVVVAPDSGLEFFGAGGSDRFTSGLGDDVVHGILGRVSFHRLGSVVATSDISGTTATASNGSVDHFDDAIQTVFGSPGDDTLAVWSPLIRPLGGDDVVGASEVIATMVAEATPDGADRATPGAIVEFDYSARTTPVRLSLNGKADDGAAGEGDLMPRGSLIGGRAADVLIGGPEGDVLRGGPGDDRIHGGRGLDKAYGDGGNDVFVDATVEQVSGDEYWGGPGLDTVTYANRPARVFATIGYQPELAYPAEHDFIDGVERLVGTRFSDFLAGGPGPDQLVGGPGRDTLRGNAGNDVLRARDDETDRVRGGGGTDTAYADRYDLVSGVERRR